jgi:DNA mismatch repair protein MutL
LDYKEINSKIKLLPEHIIDQIKAGEVIERPASLLKEILENSLDANATKISLHIVNNGLDLIELSDNGDGMSFNELPFAFTRHATSKLSRFEDLYQLRSFGFRGEALASLASVAKVKCTSVNRQFIGGKLIIQGGQIESHIEHTDNSSGTSIFIKDLFFNTPARLKFIKSKTAEKNALIKVIHGFILDNPQVAFELKWDDKEKEIYNQFSPDHNGLIQRLSDLYFKKNLTATMKENAILYFSKNYHSTNLELTMIADQFLISSTKCNYIFVNGRQIQDKQIHSIITHFSDKLGPQMFSHYVLKLDISPEDLDVNVHPNKLFVKFHNAGEIMGLISATLKSHEKTPPIQDEKISHQNIFSIEPEGTKFPQDFYLKDLKDDSPNSFMSIEEELALATIKKETKLIFLNNEFCLKDTINGYVLFNVPQLIINYLYDSLSPEEAIPLMISEPINLKADDQVLSNLSQIGFEVDRLGPEMLALRTIPKNFEKLNTRDWIKDFIIFISNNHIDAKKAIMLFLENSKSKLIYDRDLIEDILSLKDAIDLYGKNASILLNQSILQKFFKQ